MNRVDLVQGAFTTHLIGSRLTWTQTPSMFTSALIQYNTSIQSVSANVRLRWEPDRVTVIVSDDSAGSAPSDGRGRGLTGMRERTESLGGEFRLASTPGASPSRSSC